MGVFNYFCICERAKQLNMLINEGEEAKLSHQFTNRANFQRILHIEDQINRLDLFSDTHLLSLI